MRNMARQGETEREGYGETGRDNEKQGDIER